MLSSGFSPFPRLRFRADKAAEAIELIAHMKPGLTQYFVGKILYFADKSHFLDYGRLITFDRYVAMKDGPVPSAVRNMLAAAAGADARMSSPIRTIADGNAQELLKRVHVERDISAAGELQHVVPLSNRFEPSFLSATDLECLRASIEENGDRNFGYLWNKSHQEEAWRAAWQDRGDDRVADMNILLWAEPEEREAFQRQLLEYNA
jgi:uncharacterized phage-associated protein